MDDREPLESDVSLMDGLEPNVKEEARSPCQASIPHSDHSVHSNGSERWQREVTGESTKAVNELPSALCLEEGEAGTEEAKQTSQLLAEAVESLARTVQKGRPDAEEAEGKQESTEEAKQTSQLLTEAVESLARTVQKGRPDAEEAEGKQEDKWCAEETRTANCRAGTKFVEIQCNCNICVDICFCMFFLFYVFPPKG